MSLVETSISLANQFGDLSDNSRKWEGFFTTIGKVGFGGFASIAVLGFFWLLYTIIIKMIVGGSQPMFGLLLVLFLVFAALTLVYVVYTEAAKDRKDQQMKSFHAESKTGDTGRLLSDPINEPAPSVIENTTELLKVESQTRKLQ